MSSLRKQLDKLKEQERADVARRADPELEAKLDRFIADNPQLLDHYNAMSPTEQVRKLMLVRMERAEGAARRDREVKQWLDENPDIVAKVEQRIKATVGQKRQSVDISAGKIESVTQGVRGPRMGM
jgi:hypothetical protein